ncbi:unnamed protein product, partial [Durusdinium trenchii]
VETGAAEQGQRQEPMSHKPAAPTEPEQAVAVPKLYASLQVPPVESAKPKMIEDNDGEISQPRKGVLCAVEAETVPKVANPDDSKSPDKVDAKLTNTSPKRSLLQQKRDKDEGSSNRKRKAPDSAGEPSQSITPEKASHSTSEGLSDSTPEKVPDNKRRAHCEICEKPRSSLQRGAACPSCLLTLKRTEGHQSLSKLREDPNKLQQIREESLVAQESASKEKTEADPVAKRLARAEVMLQKLMNHFNIA